MKSYVYVISGEHGRQKIGSSDDPWQRIKNLQTGSPFPLKFEFIGETENGGGGAVEVEAHFMLNQHKAQGGDEWFVVPPDVAITAVMAAAHRLGYRCKPVDPDAIDVKTRALPGSPWWDKAAQIAVVIAVCYMLIQGNVSWPTAIIFCLILFAVINGALRLAAMVERYRFRRN